MRLFEHADYEQAILQAAEHFRGRGLRPAIIEKDYLVTEALRVVAATGGDRVIFKGGTSLSKGWNLIQRFSEDIDIFLDPIAFDPPLGKRGIDRELKKLRDAVGAHPALTFTERKVRRLAASDETTVSPISNTSEAPVRSPTACSSRPALPAAGNQPPS